MNLTNAKPLDDEHENKARHFFREELISNMDCTKNRWFPLRPEPSEISYFRRCKRTRMTPQDMELTHYESLEQLKDVLQRFWEEMGDHDIASRVDGLARLAWELRDTRQESGEVSPYIYVMF